LPYSFRTPRVSALAGTFEQFRLAMAYFHGISSPADGGFGLMFFSMSTHIFAVESRPLTYQAIFLSAILFGVVVIQVISFSSTALSYFLSVVLAGLHVLLTIRQVRHDSIRPLLPTSHQILRDRIWLQLFVAVLLLLDVASTSVNCMWYVSSIIQSMIILIRTQ
jgi:hypothetical protein